MKKKPTKSFREYAIKWREQATRVNPPMDNHELITIFLEAQDPDYFQNMMSAMGRPFAEAIKIGEMVENGIKTGRIVSQDTLKATTQAIQNGSGSLANRKKRDEGSMMTSGFREVQRRASHPYVQVQQGQSSYPQHYYPPPIPQYSVGPPQYIVFNAQSYARPHNQQKLKQMGMIGPIAPHHMHPDSHGFQANARCKYHSGATGHSTNDCWTLKRVVERLISEKLIVVTNGEDPPNVTNNLLPTHNDVHFVGMTGQDQEYKPIGRVEMTVGAIQEGTGRCYSPEELRKAKQIREGQLPIKKPVTETEAEEFLKKMKVQDYSIIDQLRKTHAQISLLSLLVHSKEHARVLIKVLNEAHISEDTTVNQLEKMANRFFEVNRISFTDDELPEERAGHNRALNLMVKCEWHYVKRVMVDGGSSVDVCPLSTLKSMKINTNRVRPSNVRIRAFDGSARDTIEEINLTMTIGSVDFEIVFQVVDMATSYNFLLGRPWIHTARAVPSTLHQMLKFEHDRQEIIVHGEDESSIYKDLLIPCIEAKEGCESIVYQAFEVVVVDHVEEGKPILHPRLSATSVMVAAIMLRQGFRPAQADKNKAKHRKNHGWVLQQPIPHIFYTFVKPRLQEGQNSSAHANIDEICHGLSQMFYEVNMIQAGFFVNARFNNMTCMRNSRPDLKKLSNIKIMHQEVEYDEDEVVEEIKRELEQFENKTKPNLNETELINIGSHEEVKETKISIHTKQKTRDALIQLLFEYRDVFSWSYDDMSGLNADLVVHKLPTYPDFSPV
ncbi:uncharacterized protein [Nicotiana sylvestris]|uniref:uncharacterized protein n=1 Tax=Nicotiana sylvestris TaxID=4096 RepID=UPI00388C8ABC